MDLLAHQATASFFFAGARFFGLGFGVSSLAGASGAGAVSRRACRPLASVAPEPSGSR
jgi:hypothetical protein